MSEWKRNENAAWLSNSRGSPVAMARARPEGDGYEWAINGAFGTISGIVPMPTLDEAIARAELFLSAQTET